MKTLPIHIRSFGDALVWTLVTAWFLACLVLPGVFMLCMLLVADRVIPDKREECQ